jgi:hypothetical protein
MSRNLCRTDCCYCHYDLENEPLINVHKITKQEAGNYYQVLYDLNVCDITCPICGSSYIGWIGPDSRHPKPTLFDLSFRSSFNDEPNPEDKPTVTMVIRILTKQSDPYKYMTFFFGKIDQTKQHTGTLRLYPSEVKLLLHFFKDLEFVKIEEATEHV